MGVVVQSVDIVGPILDSVETTGGGWPVLVLVLVIGAIVYLARYVLSRQTALNEQRVAERKQDFEAQLERERNNTMQYQATTDRMVTAFNQNSAAISEFSGILRPMAETLTRIDKHIERQSYQQRQKDGE